MIVYLKILLLIVLLAVFSFVGIKILYPPVGATDLLEQIYEKAAKVEKYALTYSVSATSGSDSTTYTTTGTANVIFAHNKSKTTVSLTSSKYYLSEMLEFEFYSLPEGDVMCKKVSIILPKYSCAEIDPTMGIDEMTVPTVQADLIKEWKDKKILNVSYLGTKKVIERNCYNFRFDVDVNKFMEEMKYGVSFGRGKMNYTIFSCYDEELGIPLDFSQEIVVNYSYKTYSYKSVMKIAYEATNLNFNVDESAIKLPVNSSEVRWLPRFDIVESLCEPNSNTVKLAIKARKDIQAGKANLNVSWSEYETIYPDVTVDGYNHYCFSLSDIYSNTRLTFSYKRFNDTYSRYFIIGIDCPEANGQNLYTTYGCNDCSQGKYCSMGTYSYASYTFTSDLLGAHEICTWPSSARGYLWTIQSLDISKYYRLTAETSFEGIKKNEIKILNFTLPSALKENKYFSLYVGIDGFKSSSSCSTYKREGPTFTGFFGKILEKIMNITQVSE